MAKCFRPECDADARGTGRFWKFCKPCARDVSRWLQMESFLDHQDEVRRSWNPDDIVTNPYYDRHSRV